MKKNLIRIPVGDMSREEWLTERNKGVGGSDIGSILGIDRYKPAIKLFHQKIGWWSVDGEEDNIAAYGGRIGEEYVYNFYWKYWDFKTNDEKQFLHNANNDLVQRKAKRVNAMIINPEFPWLRANIDYEINKHEDRGNGILELKMPSSMHWNSYEGSIPPGYLLQLQTYINVCGYDYGEIFALKDGRYPEIFPYEANEGIMETILDRTKQFWDNVIIGREIVNDKSLNDQEKQMALAEYEPEPESTEAYETYMKDRFKSGFYDGAVPSNSEIEDARRLYWEHHNEAKAQTNLKLEQKNIIYDYMNTNSCNAVIMKDDSMIKNSGTDGKSKLTIPKIK